MKKINLQGIQVAVIKKNNEDYISLTDMARFKDYRAAVVISNWLSTKYSIQFMGAWEQLHNPDFKVMEFHDFRNEAGTNGYVISPLNWIEKTGAIGIKSASGRYGGTFAHKDIAFEFATWLSPEFKLYLIKEFQRLKLDENKRLALGWDTKRMLTKINYRIHTDAIKKHLLPPKISAEQANLVYANEADVLNKSLFGMTAKEWRDAHPKVEGNIRDHADVTQLVCLANLENLNAEYIRDGLGQGKRLMRLNESAIIQMRSLMNSPSIKSLK